MNTPNNTTALEEMFLSIDLRLRLLELKMGLLAGEITEEQFKEKGTDLYGEVRRRHQNEKSKSVA